MNESNINKNDLLEDFIQPEIFEEKNVFFKNMKRDMFIKLALTLLYFTILLSSFILIN